jgi:hypothetical protein
MQSPDLARAARKIEQMSTDDGSVLDCLAGSILRIFARLNQIEAMNERLMRKLTALEAAETGNGVTAVGASTSGTRGNAARERQIGAMMNSVLAGKPK